MKLLRLSLSLLGLAGGSLLAADSSDAAVPWRGVDANYALQMETVGKSWSSEGKTQDVLSILQQVGFDRFRVRLWTGEEGMNGLRYAIETAKRAQAVGLKPYVTIFLSEDWADYVKQPAPAEWKNLAFTDKLKAVEAYAERVARTFQQEGVEVNEFEIGNEIDFGICGEFEEDWAKRVSIPLMKASIWPKAAQIILAAETGVRKVRPEAKFILHLTQWWDAKYGAAFFETMMEQGVAVDYAGLSFFPTSNLSKKNSFDFFLSETGKLHEILDRKIVICEFGYPSAAHFPGQFAEWNRPVEGYSLDEEGQKKWLADFFAVITKSGFFEGAFYWSPEWYDSEMWSAFSLFDAEGGPKAALKFPSVR